MATKKKPGRKAKPTPMALPEAPCVHERLDWQKKDMARELVLQHPTVKKIHERITGDLDKVARKHTKEGEQAVKKADAMMMPKGKKKKAAKKKMPKGFMKGKKAQMME